MIFFKKYKIDTILCTIDSKIYITPALSVTDKVLYGRYEISISWLMWDFSIGLEYLN